MRLLNIRPVAICVMGLAVSACPPSDITNGVVAIGSLPRVCPSSVRVDSAYLPSRLKFNPYVENRGVNDSTTPFNLYLVVRRSDGTVVQKLTFSSPNLPIIGTHAATGVTAGPEVELITTTTLASRTMANDPTQTFGVTLTVQSADSTFNTANQDCHQLGPVSFKDGQPL